MLLCVALLTSPALAENTSRTINVAYRDIRLVVDGVEVTLKDVNGVSVEPFAYNGTTYLPVRAVAEALKKEVSWDGDASTVYYNNRLLSAKRPVKTRHSIRGSCFPQPGSRILCSRFILATSAARFAPNASKDDGRTKHPSYRRGRLPGCP